MIFAFAEKSRKLVSHPQKLDLFLHNRLFHSGSYIRACQVRAVDFFMPTGKNAQKHIRRIRADGEQRGAERRATLLIRPNDERKACHRAAERGKRLRRPQAQKRA